ncbi:MAG: DUF3563 family protein [Alsobacter sp.]
MAHPIASLPLRGVSVSQTGSLLERALYAFVSARVQRASAELSRYDSLAQRYGRTTRRKTIPAHPTLAWFVSAQVSAWKTVDELTQHTDRTLDDIQIPREAIRALAVLSAFGWPRDDASPARAPAGMLAQLRRRFFPSDSELQNAYLSEAADIYDLEYRMSEWDRRGTMRTAGGLRAR